MRLVGALGLPCTGSLLLDGKDLSQLRPGQLADSLTRTLGFVFQNHTLMPTLTAAENVQAAPVPLGVPWSEARRRARDNQSTGSQAG
jgi:putative ABC transport system ATP-binding protein